MFNADKKQSGAVSLFVVLFSAILITVVTVGFISIMVRNQKQASDNDLSQSAYDSALAGVEDGKRAILRYLKACTNTGSPECAADILNPVNTQTCTNAVSGLEGISIVNNEVVVQTNASDSALNQAYTCVKVDINTPNYLGVLDKDSSKLIPLTGAGPFTRIRINWYAMKDLSSGTTANLTGLGFGTPLLANSGWINRPSIMRAQLIQYGSNGFSVTDFDSNVNPGSRSNSSTLFLYPTPTPSPVLSFFVDARRAATNSPKKVYCESDFSQEGYACSVMIDLPDAINGGNRVAYLNLTSLYSKSDYKITLMNVGGGTVNFSGVQPEVDSTGRANDLFRRVKTRVEMTTANFPYPEVAIDSEDRLCKDYLFFLDPGGINNAKSECH